MIYQLPQLAYSYDSLEPYIDAVTMEIHHSKHHQAYTNNLNTVLEKYPSLKDKKLEEILSDLANSPFDPKDTITFKNNAGGYLNHNLYWNIMGPKKEIDETLLSDIKKEFGSAEEFKKILSAAAVSHFGSGWTWLSRDGGGNLQLYTLPNQDTPFQKGHTPVLCLDVWEHAYYLKYQNRRAEYVENWWHVLKLI